ncbi:MAG: hypothetical protein J6T01_06190 [Kiritimatiellae bacterium]|nr:hypothetical protein [Kiritimatiellia bacterium]
MTPEQARFSCLAEPSLAGRICTEALLVAVATFALFSLFPHTLLHPSVWDDLAVAAGLRPPGLFSAGLYRTVVYCLFRILPAAAVLGILPVLGRICIAASAAGVYLVFRDVLPATLRLYSHMGRFNRYIGVIVASIAAVLFVSAEPVWRAGRTFSPVSVFLVLVAASAVLFFRFLRRGLILPLYCCFALLGTLSATTALGFALSILAAWGVVQAGRRAGDPNESAVNPMVHGLVREVVFKRLAYTWGFFFLLTVAQAVYLFMTTGGMEATGHAGVLGLLLAYFQGIAGSVMAAATGAGWLFGLFLAFFPMVFVLALLRVACNDDDFLSHKVGIVYLTSCVVALSQFSCVRALRFWTWIGDAPMVPSDILLSFFLLLDVAVVAFAVAVFGIDAHCRNYRRIAQRRFPDSMQFEEPARIAESLGRTRTFRRRLFGVMTVAVPLCVVPGWWRSPEREMEGLVADYGKEVLRETENCSAIFTDGGLDLLFELEAARAGRVLNCLSLLAPATVRERIVRLRAAENAEDRALLENDAVSTLSTWIASDSGRLSRTAVQVGLELWQKKGRAVPPVSGVVALPGGLSYAEKDRAVSLCRGLGASAVGIAERGCAAVCSDFALRRAFSFVLWRLSRMAQARGRAADLAGRRSEAVIEATAAEDLDLANPSLSNLRRDATWRKWRRSGVLTPREGLVIGLSRADFALAGRYARPVLAADPTDPRANFAMGMMYYADEQYTRAEPYLLRCLVKRPDDAAVLNNLALIQMKIGKLEEAEKYARRAVARLPDSDETRRTLEQIRAVIAKTKKKR